jgi:hypothetical protein
MAFNFVAAYAESPLPFYVHGVTAGTTALTEAPQQITLRFAPGVQFDLATDASRSNVASSIKFVRAGHDNAFGDIQDVSVMPLPNAPSGTAPAGLIGGRPAGSVTVGDAPNGNEIVIRFASTLPDDLYRVTIEPGLKSTTGDTLASRVEFDVRLSLGAFVKAVVPQPVARGASGLTQSRQEVHVYFNENDPLTLSSAEKVHNYRLVPMESGTDGSPVSPLSVTYNSANSKAVLTFAPGAIADGSLYRLEIGSTLTPGTPPDPVSTGLTGDDNSSFASAWPLGALGTPDKDAIKDEIRVTAKINGQPSVQTPFGPLTFPNQPGTVDEPGHRDIPANSGAHGLPSLDARPALPSWVFRQGSSDVPVGFYNFRNHYGFDVQGNALLNTITEAQKARTREIFEAFSRVMGIRFVEELPPPDGLEQRYIGLTVATGDRRTKLEDGLVTEPIDDGYGISGKSPLTEQRLFSDSIPVAVVESNQDWGDSDYGGNWFRTAMRQIGGALGLSNSYDLSSIMGYGLTGEPVFPGDYDTIHLRQLFPAIGSDIDLYAFDVLQQGAFTAETVAGRASKTEAGQRDEPFVDTLISLYREDTVGSAKVRTLVSRNDDYYGRDSLIGIDLQPGKYFVAVTSTGNDRFNPEVSDSGYGGRTTGPYELLLGLKPDSIANATIVDKQGTPLDGDRDGQPGGTFAFWFNTASADETVFVDKLANAAGANGSLARPYKTISAALAAAESASDGSKTLVRIIGNAAQEPYLVGRDIFDQPLPDGATLNVPKGVTVMIDEGAVFKLRSAIIDVGSSQPLDSTSRAGAALQVLGVPGNAVKFTSYHDDTLGTDPKSIVKPGGDDGAGPAPQGGQWGGIVFRADSDDASKRAFVNAVQCGEFRYGGGQVRVDSEIESFAPIQMENARPTVAFNTIIDSAGAAIAATPNSFNVADGRIGPEIRGNVLSEWRQDRPGVWNLHQNTTNGLSVKILNRPGAAVEPEDGTGPGGSLNKLDVTARFKSTDIVYVIQENLVISGGAGGYRLKAGSGQLTSRGSGNLVIDPGVVVKLQNSRIELERGESQLIAEGDERNPVIFTSLGDYLFGAGGTFDTNGNVPDVRKAGDWAGIVLNAGAEASIDHAYIAFGGGQSPTEGVIDGFNVIEVHQGDLRLTNTRIEQNLSGVLAGAPATDRNGRGSNAPATVFVRGAQPIIVDSDFRTNEGAVISINANSLSDVARPDVGRSTGRIDRFDRFDDNFGPLVADNVLDLRGVAAIAGMKVRGEEITVEGVWDDTSIAHVVEEEIIVRNFHTATGLRLLSKPGESLVVKFRGATAGLTAEGYGLDIDDRIGGTVQIVGQPGHPVILTSLSDDKVGASVDPLGKTVFDTGNDGTSTPRPGDWRSLKFLPMSNDRNVSIYVEAEDPLTAGIEVNATVAEAERLGMLAPNFATGTNSWESAQEKSGDETRRLGFEVHGFVSPDDPTDVDVYTFLGYAGSEVWIDLDKTGSALDAMVELLDSFGNILFRSVDGQVDAALSLATRWPGANLFAPDRAGGVFDMKRDAWRGGDFYTTNPRDPGMRVVLPGTLGQELRYFVRVRSQPRQHDGTGALVPKDQFETRLRSTSFDQPGDPAGGVTSGGYELRIRLRQRDEKPGSVVRYADIRYPTVGVDVLGLPRSSLLTSEAGESPAVNGVFAQSQYVGNLLTSDRNTISVSGAITDATDVDWYRISLTHDELRTLGGATTWSTVFDLDYGDGFRGDLTLSVFDQDGRLIFVGSDSDVIDDQPAAGQGADFDDLSRGSIGKLDPFIGSVHMPAGNPANLVLATAAPTPFGSTTVRVAAGLINLPGVGALVAGPGIAGGTTVVAVDAVTGTVTLSKPTAAVITADTDLSFISGGARDYYVAVSSNTRLPSAIAGTFGVNRPSGQSVRVQLTSAQTAIGASAITLADVTGIAVGMTVSGTGIVEGTTVLAVNTVTRAISISRLTTATIAGGTALSFAADRVAYVELATLGVTAVGATSVTLANVPEVAGVEAGMTVTGTGMAAGTTVAAVNQATRVVTLSGQTTGPIPAGSRLALSWPGLARLEPINSLRRIAEDHIGSTGYFSGGGNPPVGDVKLVKIDPDMGGTPLIDVTSPTSLDLHVRPFRFGDVTLFVSTAGGVATYDPVTGALETTLGSGSSIGDLDIRTDGRLYSYAGVAGDRTTVGRLNELDTGTGAVIFSDFDEIEDRVPTTPTTPPAYQTTSDFVTALAFGRTGTTAEGAAEYGQLWFIVQDGSQSKLYRAADGGTGAAASNPDAKSDQTQSDVDYGYRGRIAVDINNDGDFSDFDERPLVTGLQFLNDNGVRQSDGSYLMYGVTDTGKVIKITPGTKPQQPTLDTVDYESTATLVVDLLPELQKIGATGFTALAAAPRNLYDGQLAGKFFALTNTGRLALIDVNNIPGAQMLGTLGILTDTGATGGFVTVIGDTTSLLRSGSRTGVSQFDVAYAAGTTAITVNDQDFTGFEAATLVTEMIVVADDIDPGTYLATPPDSLDTTPAQSDAILSNPINASAVSLLAPFTFIEPSVVEREATLTANSTLVGNIDTTGVSKGMVVFASTPDGADPDLFVELGDVNPTTNVFTRWLPVGTLVESVVGSPSATGEIRLTQPAPLAASNVSLRFIRPDALLTTDRVTPQGTAQLVVSQTALFGLEVRQGMQVFGRGVPFNTTVTSISEPTLDGLVTILLTKPLATSLARAQLVAFVDGRTVTLPAGTNVKPNMLVLDQSIDSVVVYTADALAANGFVLNVGATDGQLVAGMRISGPGIPDDTRLESASFSSRLRQTFGPPNADRQTITLNDVSGIVKGMSLSGTSIAANTTVVAVDLQSRTISLSIPTTGDVPAATELSFQLATIRMSNPTLTTPSAATPLLFTSDARTVRPSTVVENVFTAADGFTSVVVSQPMTDSRSISAPNAGLRFISPDILARPFIPTSRVSFEIDPSAIADGMYMVVVRRIEVRTPQPTAPGTFTLGLPGECFANNTSSNPDKLIAVGMTVAGRGIAAGTKVLAVNAATNTVTISSPTTESISAGEGLSFEIVVSPFGAITNNVLTSQVDLSLEQQSRALPNVGRFVVYGYDVSGGPLDVTYAEDADRGMVVVSAATSYNTIVTQATPSLLLSKIPAQNTTAAEFSLLRPQLVDGATFLDGVPENLDLVPFYETINFSVSGRPVVDLENAVGRQEEWIAVGEYIFPGTRVVSVNSTTGRVGLSQEQNISGTNLPTYDVRFLKPDFRLRGSGGLNSRLVTITGPYPTGGSSTVVDLHVGMIVMGHGIPYNTRIQSISGNDLILDKALSWTVNDRFRDADGDDYADGMPFDGVLNFFRDGRVISKLTLPTAGATVPLIPGMTVQLDQDSNTTTDGWAVIDSVGPGNGEIRLVRAVNTAVSDPTGLVFQSFVRRTNPVIAGGSVIVTIPFVPANPGVLGIVPGMAVSGTGIEPGTTVEVVDRKNNQLRLSAPVGSIPTGTSPSLLFERLSFSSSVERTTQTDSSVATSSLKMASVLGVFPGMKVEAPLDSIVSLESSPIADDTFVLTVDSASSTVTLSKPLQADVKQGRDLLFKGAAIPSTNFIGNLQDTTAIQAGMLVFGVNVQPNTTVVGRSLNGQTVGWLNSTTVQVSDVFAGAELESRPDLAFVTVPKLASPDVRREGDLTVGEVVVTLPLGTSGIREGMLVFVDGDDANGLPLYTQLPFNTRVLSVNPNGTITLTLEAKQTLSSAMLEFVSTSSTGYLADWGNDQFSPVIVANGTGIAFSPLDVNLWHTTERRRLDEGHGIESAPDNSRPFVPGGTSMYFGLEESQQGQFGVLNADWQRDLTIGTGRGGTYDLPGGAFGSLTTNPFSLQGYTYTQKPTLYFNYLLQSENASGDTASRAMRDSARVFISKDSGTTWELIATNNSQRGATNTELPWGPSASSRLNRDDSRQIVQELFDTGSWRQARIDLGDYVGLDNLRLRFDFHTAGQFDPAGDPTGQVSGFASATGNFNDAERGQFNRFEGFYVDDIIVGLAGRGEMVTGADPGDTEFVTVNQVLGAPRQVLDGPYQLEIRRGTDYASVVKDSNSIVIDRRFTVDERLIPSLPAAAGAGGLRGDSSPAREQGQFVVESNLISYARDYGISIDAGARDAIGLIPHPGSAQNYATLNGGRLVPGAFVVNNVVELSAPGSTQASLAGIRFSGDAEPGDVPPAVVPYGKIVNNTLYGGTTARGTGITVTDNAAPTVINNLFANLATGVAVDASSLRDAANNERTVVLHSAFFNTTAQVTGATPRFSAPTLTSDPFEGASNRNFYLRPGTAAIDTSLDSLQDRTEFVVVKSPLGVPAAPIRAPEKDLYGQLRADDPTQSPSVSGLGANAFKDIGAIDRVDFSLSLPFLTILNPLDNGPADGNAVSNAVALEREAARGRTRFTFQITDRGAGINPQTVTSAAFVLERNGIPLVPDKDYVFAYLESTNRVVFTAASVFQPGSYRLVAYNKDTDPSRVKDLAGNSLRPTTPAGVTEFQIDLRDVPQAPTWLAASSLLAGWHESQTIYLGWNAGFTVLPILGYDVEMSLDGFLTSSSVATTTATALTVPGLTNGTQYWFRVRATNALGTGPWSDILGPIVPQPKPSIALADDTGSSPTDNITKNGLVNITGIAPNASWQYRVASGAWTTGTGTSFTLADAVYAAGDVQVRQIVSGFPSVPASNATQWEVDSAAPAAPSITSVTDNVSSPGTSPITNGASTIDTTPTFNGTVTANAALTVSVNSGMPTPVSFPYTPTLAYGTHTFSFVATDPAGNTSTATTFSLTVIPKSPVITSAIDDVSPVTGPIPDGGTTNDARPTFNGTVEPGTLLTVSRNGGAFNQLPVSSDGTWTWTRGNDLPAGTHTFSFVATDASGTVRSTATTFTLTVDTVSPPPPVITSVADNVAPGTSPITNGGVTNDPTPTFNGTVEPGSSLTVSRNGGLLNPVLVSPDGFWTYEPPSRQDGTYTFSFIATDAAGNVSTATIFILTVDTVAPIVAPPVTASSPSGTYGVGQFVDIQVSFSKPVFVTGVPSLQLNTTPSRTATYVSGNGTPVLTFRYAIQTGDRATRLDYASASALNLNAGSILSAAALPATLTLPAPGGFLGKNIVIDAIIRATVAGLGQWPTTPDFNSPVNTFQLQFNTAVTGFTVGSFKLQRLADSADPASGRDVSLSGVSLTGSGTTWTITLPSSTNPSSLPGRYKLIIGGLGSGIESAGVAMDVASEWFFDRI